MVNICRHDLRGMCRWGAECRFTHLAGGAHSPSSVCPLVNSSASSDDPATPVARQCRFSLRGEPCPFGGHCRFVHASQPPPVVTLCRYWLDAKPCPYGARCVHGHGMDVPQESEWWCPEREFFDAYYLQWRADFLMERRAVWALGTLISGLSFESHPSTDTFTVHFPLVPTKNDGAGHDEEPRKIPADGVTHNLGCPMWKYLEGDETTRASLTVRRMPPAEIVEMGHSIRWAHPLHLVGHRDLFWNCVRDWRHPQLKTTGLSWIDELMERADFWLEDLSKITVHNEKVFRPRSGFMNRRHKTWKG